MRMGGNPPKSDWYPDPEGSGRLRFWDGSQWTGRFADPGSSPQQRERRRPSRVLLVLLLVAALAIAGTAAAVLVLGSSESSEERVAFAGADDASVRTVTPDGSDYNRVGVDTGTLNGWDISPDGRSVVMASGDESGSRVYLVDLDSAERIEIGPGVSPQFSPDGSRVDYNTEGSESGQDSNVKSYDLASGEVTTLGPGYLIECIPGSDQVLAGFSRSEGEDYRSDVLILDPDGIVRTIADASTAAASPQGGRIAFVRDEGGEEDYEPVIFLTAPGDAGMVRVAEGDSPVFSPDGRQLVYTRYEGYEDEESVIRLLDVESGEQQRLTEGYQPVFSPDGSTLLFTRSSESEEDYSEELRLVDIETGEETGLGEGEGAGFSGDGEQVVYSRDVGDEDWEPMIFTTELQTGVETSLTEGSSPTFYEARK